MKRTKRLAITIIALSALGSDALARPGLTSDSAYSAIAVRYLRLGLNSDYVESIISQTFYFDLQFRLHRSSTLTFELPFAFSEWNDRTAMYPPHKVKEDVTGGIGLTFTHKLWAKPYYYRFGVRLPSALNVKTMARLVGEISDLSKFGAFTHDYLILTGSFGYRPNRATGLTAHLEIAPAYWIDVVNKDIDRDEAEAVIHNKVNLSYIYGLLDFQMGITGMEMLTDEKFLFNGSTVFVADLGCGIEVKNIRPGLAAHYPLTENMRDILDFILEFNLEIKIN